MNVDFRYLPEFERRAKALAKKYKSFVKDYECFLDSMSENPFQGKPLGNGVYKIRMAITSKGKGKSGGARILTYNVTKEDDESVVVTLMTIYDKSEISNIKDSYIDSLIKQINNI